MPLGDCQRMHFQGFSWSGDVGQKLLLNDEWESFFFLCCVGVLLLNVCKCKSLCACGQSFLQNTYWKLEIPKVCHIAFHLQFFRSANKNLFLATQRILLEMHFDKTHVALTSQQLQLHPCVQWDLFMDSCTCCSPIYLPAVFVSSDHYWRISTNIFCILISLDEVSAQIAV